MSKYLIFSLLSIIFWSCTSGKKALDRGNYEEASLKAIERLRSSPDNSKAQATLKDAYNLALSYHLNTINQLRSSNQLFRWESIAESYKRLNVLHDEIQRCPSCLKVIPKPMLFLNEVNDSYNLAASERYDAGDKLMKDAYRTRQTAREAFEHFRRAEQLVPNYKDAKARADEAYFYATLKVVVEQMPIHSRTYNLSNEFFQNKIYEYITTNRRMNEFVRFYTPQEAMSEKLQYPDHILKLQFDDFSVGNVVFSEKTETLTSKDSVQVGEVVINGVKRPVLNKVSAKFTCFKKTVISNGILDMQIIEPSSNKVVFQDKTSGQFTWSCEWAKFNGDERALTSAQRTIANQREVMPPPAQDLFVEFCKPIYDQVTRKIKNYYKNY
jgi:tetratricopeptide (TPR) repeat protein